MSDTFFDICCTILCYQLFKEAKCDCCESDNKKHIKKSKEIKQ